MRDSARISDRIQRPADKSGVLNLQCPETNFTFSVSALNKRIQGGPNIVILEKLELEFCTILLQVYAVYAYVVGWVNFLSSKWTLFMHVAPTFC